MATLADLFNQSSQNIYKRFAPSSAQPVVIKPDTSGVFGSKSRIKTDSRAVPTISVLRDTKRVSKFLTSSDGLLFIGTQTLLQTGNTFVNTRLYNPTSILANTVPFTHIRRNIKIEVGTSGLLQNSTVSKLNEKIGGERVAIGLISQLKGAISNTLNPAPQLYETSRPEYSFIKSGTGPRLFAVDALSTRGTPRIGIQQLAAKDNEDYLTDFVAAAKKFKDNFYSANGSVFRFRSKYFTEEKLTPAGEIPNDQRILTAEKGYTLLKDPYNIASIVKAAEKGDNDPNKLNYNNIIKNQQTKSDIIKFIFSEVNRDNANFNPVHFRALISSIKESTKPQFNEQQYIGRTERFVTYGGAKRSLTLAFNIVAFSRDELDGMWSRVNYLSGLAFPKDVKNGFMVPPLFKITIGELYESQPCYIELLDYDFLDETITFDINNEVPFAINVTMQLSLLEKRSRFFNSPFYKITEGIANKQTTNI